MCIPPLTIAAVALVINGIDYFVGGMIAIVSGPIVYVIFRRRFGGLTVNDPEKHPMNPRTRLAVGDLRRMTWIFAGLTAIGIIGALFLPMYEDPQSYTDMYGIDGLFDILMMIIWLSTTLSGLATVGLGIAARRIEPKRAATSTLA
jgi:hypothetical protein